MSRLRSAALTLAVMAVATAPVSGQQTLFRDTVPSPSLRSLAAAVAEGDEGALEAFWTTVEREGTPLVEPDPAPGHSLVTILHRGRGEGATLELVTALASLQEAPTGLAIPFEHLGGTDVHFRTFRLRNDARAPYWLQPRGTDAAILDPLNPRVWEPNQSALAASVVELPGAPGQPWRGAGAEAGDWDELALPDGDGGERSVYVYKPQGWSAEGEAPYPALVGLGAFGIGIGMRVDWMADDLISRGLLRALVFVLVDLTSQGEPSLYRSTEAFLAETVLPYVREHYGVTSDPASIVLAGTSRCGMVSSLLALRRPDLFGNVLSLSGSYYWKPEAADHRVWLASEYARAERRPVRFYVAAGELETFVTPGNHGHYMVGTNRHFRDVLRARGYDLAYVEFNGVHSELNWQDWLAEGLRHFFRPAPR